jgi:hypothetical protein
VSTLYRISVSFTKSAALDDMAGYSSVVNARIVSIVHSRLWLAMLNG